LNGVLAILAGIVADLGADWFGFGPVSKSSLYAKLKLTLFLNVCHAIGRTFSYSCTLSGTKWYNDIDTLERELRKPRIWVKSFVL